MTVTPSSGLHDGDPMQVELRGFAGHLVGISLCPASVQDGGIDLLEMVSACGLPRFVEDVTTSPFVLEGAIGAREWVQGTHCAARPGACIVAAFGRSHARTRFAVTPIEVVSSPLTVRPTEGVAGTAVKANVGGEPGAEITLTQCVRPVGESLSGSRCGRGRTLVLNESGGATADVGLAQTLGTPAGAFSCVGPKCAIATFDAAGTTLASQDVTVFATDPIRVSVVPPPSGPWQFVSVDDGQEIEVTVTGRPAIPVTVAQCDPDRLSQYSNVEDGPCRVLAELGPAEGGTYERTARVAVHREQSLADGTVVDCNTTALAGTCVLVVEGDDGGEFVVNFLKFPG